MSATCLFVLASCLLQQLQCAACLQPDGSDTKQCSRLDEFVDDEVLVEAQTSTSSSLERAQKFPNCGRANTIRLAQLNKTRVAGGYNAKPGEYPAYVYLRAVLKSGNEVAQCGGTILSPTHVLTAAHCLKNLRELWVQPTIKQPRRTPRSAPDKWFKAKRWCLHNYWRSPNDSGSEMRNDIGLIKLERAIKFDRRTQSACLPEKAISKDQQAYAVGLGITKGPKDPREAETLQVLPVKRSTCSTPVDSSRVCFRTNKQKYVGDTCVGE